MNTSNRSPAVNEAKNEAPEIYSGKVGVEIVPDMRKLRSFAKDFIALVDSYWPEQSVNDVGEADGRSGGPEELPYDHGISNGIYSHV